MSSFNSVELSFWNFIYIWITLIIFNSYIIFSLPLSIGIIIIYLIGYFQFVTSVEFNALVFLFVVFYSWHNTIDKLPTIQGNVLIMRASLENVRIFTLKIIVNFLNSKMLMVFQIFCWPVQNDMFVGLLYMFPKHSNV